MTAFIGAGIVGTPWYRFVSIDGGSMSPTIARGDLGLIAPPPSQIEPGMILLLKIDGGLAMAVIPANHRLRLEQLKELIDAERLDPADAQELFYIFKDETSGKETYGAGRFFYSAMPKDGTVTLDFNKAYNPPCAFTPYATCPLPPPENRLAVRIEAGEKKYDH